MMVTMMRNGKACHRLLATAVGVVAFAGVAHAQATKPADETKGYVQVFAQSAFGNVTSQAYGGEVGYTVWQDLQLFVEGGQVRNVATATISNGAQTIAAALAQLQSAAVTYSVKQPVTSFAAGIRYPLRVEGSKVRPYVLGGFGAARVKNDVSFQFNGADASSTLGQFVTLGDDLSGSHTKPMLTLGGGVVWPAWQQVIVDFQFRYGRIFAEGVGINISRAGLGLGIRF